MNNRLFRSIILMLMLLFMANLVIAPRVKAFMARVQVHSEDDESETTREDQYYNPYGYGGYYGSGLYGGGLYGMGSMYGLGSTYGGLYGLGSLYGGYSMYGGLYGMGMNSWYGGGMGGWYGGSSSGLGNPFGFQNLYYNIDTGNGLSYQVPFLQIAPILGMATLYNQLFPNLFNNNTSSSGSSGLPNVLY